ncbi:hypothetical protein M404DRAFT_160686, partial [Pisolithus tinctorius Marx 270]
NTSQEITILAHQGHFLRATSANAGVHYNIINRVCHQHHWSLQKPAGSHLLHCFPINAPCVLELISSVKAENGVEVQSNIHPIINKPITH